MLSIVMLMTFMGTGIESERSRKESKSETRQTSQQQGVVSVRYDANDARPILYARQACVGVDALVHYHSNSLHEGVIRCERIEQFAERQRTQSILKTDSLSR